MVGKSVELHAFRLDSQGRQASGSRTSESCDELRFVMSWKHVIATIDAEMLVAAFSVPEKDRGASEIGAVNRLFQIIHVAVALCEYCDAQLHVLTVTDDPEAQQLQACLILAAQEKELGAGQSIRAVLSPETWNVEAPQLTQAGGILVADIKQRDAPDVIGSNLPVWFVSEKTDWTVGIRTLAVCPEENSQEAVIEYVRTAITLPLQLTLQMNHVAGQTQEDLLSVLDSADTRSTEYGVQVRWPDEGNDADSRASISDFDLLLTLAGMPMLPEWNQCPSILQLPKPD